MLENIIGLFISNFLKTIFFYKNRLNLKLPLIIEPKGPYRALENLFGKS